VILFRGSGADARRYLESDRSVADDYYLGDGVCLAELTVVDGAGEVVGAGSLTPVQYAAWVNWKDPLAGQSRGVPREAGPDRRNSPRFAEMVINVPKSLSIAAALHPEVSAALDRAQADAAGEARRFLGAHSVTRVGPRGGQEVVPVELLETVEVVHRTSRAGDPHRHVHFQIGTRVFAAGKWRALDTSALMNHQQGVIRALVTAVIAAHPDLADTLAAHGLTLDPVTGEVVELQPFNALMSKRGKQVEANLTALEAEWRAANPGESIGPVVAARLHQKAWALGRPAKRPTTLADEAGWLAELTAAGYVAPTPGDATSVARGGVGPVAPDDLSIQEVASRSLDRAAARASTWTVHDLRMHVTMLTTEHGVRAQPIDLRVFIDTATMLALDGTASVLPPGASVPEHVAHLTSVHVVAVETALRDALTDLATASTTAAYTGAATVASTLAGMAAQTGLDDEQLAAATAVASTRPLVVVEGAAGAGKTTMLGAAINAAATEGRAMRIVTPTRKAAQVAAAELGVPTDSVAALVYAHGFRWNPDGVWSRLTLDDVDPGTGKAYTGPLAAARLAPGERVVVDEAGMFDQDTAFALLTVIREAGATVALVGDRAQLPAVGRGGVLDMAAAIIAAAGGRTVDMTAVHRFADPDYANLTLAMREGDDPAAVFDRLAGMGLVVLHDTDDTSREHIAATVTDGAVVTVATNEQARELNEAIRAVRVEHGQVDNVRTVTGVDGLPIGAGDVIQTRRNDTVLGVTNRQTWTVQHIGDDGSVYVTDNDTGRRHHATVALPPSYVAEHTHLAYASTAYGVQGATVDTSHTVLSDVLSAASVYVAMTRGRRSNVLHIVARNITEAREQFVAAMGRDRADRGLAVATEAAVESVKGLVADGPVNLVAAERARLQGIVNRAEAEAGKWEHARDALARQRAQHRVEADELESVIARAQHLVEQTRNLIAEPLVKAAAVDASTLQEARLLAAQARGNAGSARGFRKHSAARTRADADATCRDAEDRVRRRWGTAPQPGTDVTVWAHQVADLAADAHPQVVAAHEGVEDATAELSALKERHRTQRATLGRQVLAGTTPSDVPRSTHRTSRRTSGAFAGPTPPNPRAEASAWRRWAEAARADLARIDALPLYEASALIRARMQEQATRNQSRHDGPRNAQPDWFAHRPDTGRTPGPGRTL
jgi:hypothetical protein